MRTRYFSVAMLIGYQSCWTVLLPAVQFSFKWMNEWMKNWRWPAFQHSFHFISLYQTRTARETLLLTYYFQLLWTYEHMFVYLVHNFSPGERNYVSWWQLTSHWCSIKKRKYTVLLSLCLLPTCMAAKLRSSSCVTSRKRTCHTRFHRRLQQIRARKVT